MNKAGFTLITSPRQRRRLLLDRSMEKVIAAGGLWVIVTILAIFIYLLYVVLPIFQSASITPHGNFALPAAEQGESLLIDVEESFQLGSRLTANGQLSFFNLTDGQLVRQEQLPLAAGQKIVKALAIGAVQRHLVLLLEGNQLLIAKVSYKVSFDGDRRVLTPRVQYPHGKTPLALPASAPLIDLDAVLENEALILALVDDSRQLQLLSYRTEYGEPLTTLEQQAVIPAPQGVAAVHIDANALWLYLVGQDNSIQLFDLRDRSAPLALHTFSDWVGGSNLIGSQLLLGGSSLLVADAEQQIHQLSIQRDSENRYQLRQVRSFNSSGSISTLIPERLRKGFTVLDQEGGLDLFYTTSERTLLREEKLLPAALRSAAMAPRGDGLLVETRDNRLLAYELHNPHPEISWSTLWSKVQYEGYPEPQYIWQSSAANNDFEAKFSLIPLVFGTFKAAFYAMLFSVPLAILGAIYTAYFMSPKMRGWVKPAIEMMAALPTVILGFLVGLWLAPMIENHLLAIFLLLLMLGPLFFLCAWLWHLAPAALRYRLPEGWEALLLVPVVLFGIWLAFAVAPGIESLLFGGSLRRWLPEVAGIHYDQRNALVVGIAMGVAVIPNIFSITEDAIFSVPKHLTLGSLALGATPWQTLTRVVLLTASPGIFSAVMIGMGRAVGETMIVLMATGNTPVMDFSIFEGLRTLSANIAVEMPESEVNSSHYRILFLAALVLFAVTFIFNTAAELVRQNLRKRYGNL